jgi:hypothetical protein
LRHFLKHNYPAAYWNIGTSSCAWRSWPVNWIIRPICSGRPKKISSQDRS